MFLVYSVRLEEQGLFSRAGEEVKRDRTDRSNSSTIDQSTDLAINQEGRIIAHLIPLDFGGNAIVLPVQRESQISFAFQSNMGLIVVAVCD